MLQELSSDEGSIGGSLWLSFHLFLTQSEWASFFSLFPMSSLCMYRSSGVLEKGLLTYNSKDFLIKWEEYYRGVEEKTPCDDKLFRPFFSLYLTLSPDTVRVKSVGDCKGFIVPIHPCITMQLHRFSLSETGKVLSGVFGSHTVPWGVTLSFPQVAQNQKTKTIMRTLTDQKSQNRELWRAVQQFVRNSTIPVPFISEGKKIWAPIRMGREAIPLFQSGYFAMKHLAYDIDVDALLKLI